MLPLKEALTQQEINLISAALQKDELNIQRRQLRDEAIHYLSQRLTQKHYNISLMSVNLTQIGANHLSKSSTQNLKSLFLNSNQIGNKGCKYLTKAMWNQLQYLCINRNHFDSAGVIHLSKAKWGNLKSIVMIENNLSIGSLRTLIRANFPTLFHLSLTNKLLITTQVKSCLSSFEVKFLLLIQWKQLKLIWLNDSIGSFKNQTNFLKYLIKLKLPKAATFLK